MNAHSGWRKRGAIMGLVALAILVLLGMAALTIDVGQLVVAAQTAQKVADAAALAGGPVLPDYDWATYRAVQTVNVNNNESEGYDAVCNASEGDIEFWGANSTVPGFGDLGSAAWAMRVTAHVDVDYAFASALGLEGTTVHRRATVCRMPVGGVPICPMWVSYETEYHYGMSQNLLMADGPHYANIPGNFGWLEPPSGTTDFTEMLKGYNLSPDLVVANYVTVGDVLTGRTGVDVGSIRKALVSCGDGTARLQRAYWDPWTNDTFWDLHDDNPRIMIIPMCEYLGDSGTGARFKIHKFGAFWLESVDLNSDPRQIVGRFIRYQDPGAGGNALAPETGLWTCKLVR